MPQLTGEHFYKFFQCPHWIWYDIYGPQDQRAPQPPLLEMIYRGRMINAGNNLRGFKEFEEIKPELYRDLEEAFLATLELMRKGKNVFHGVLMDGDWVGIVDLLVAMPGKSDFGDWHYVAYDAQNSLDLRDEFKFPLVFYSLILERLQGVRPSQAYVIDPAGNERSFVVNDFVDQFHTTRQEIEKILNGDKPAPFLRSGCRRTPWYSLCLSETRDCSDVSLIYKLTQADQRRLYDLGIHTVHDLAVADIDHLRNDLEDWPYDKLVRLSNQAKVLESNQPLTVRKPEFPTVRHEVFFDIESDPTRDLDYLLGVLVRDTETGEAQYRKFLAKNKSEEPMMWQGFLDFLAGLDDFVIYHYAYYERQVFDRLALRYGAPAALIDKFRDNTIDLHLKVVDSVILPLYFYTLKDVAKYCGYEWHDPHAGGAESVTWYHEWNQTGDPAVLERIVQYNEDDVRATLLVKDWLCDQKPIKTKDKEKLDLPEG